MPRWSHSSMKWAPFERRLGEQHAVVGDDPDRMAVDPGEAGDQRRAVLRLELVERAAVHQPGDDLAHVVGRAGVDRHHAVELRGVDGRLLAGRDRPGRRRARAGRVATMSRTIRSACASSSARWSVTPEIAGVHLAAAELLGGDHLAGRRLHQRRAAQEDRALVADDHRLVAHRRHVGAAGRAGAQDGGDLRDARRRTSGPGCRRCGRSARGRGRPRPASAGRRRPSRPGRRTAAGSPARSPGRAGAS